MRLLRGSLFPSCIVAMVLVLSGTRSHAEFPDREIRIVVPFPAGGGADTWARLYSQKLWSRLGKPVIVDNKPGANTQIGAAAVARANPDGHTLLFTSATFIQQPALYPQLSYDVVRDFSPVGQIGTTPLVFVVSQEVKATNMRELVALARKGERLNFGSYAQGSAGAVFGEYLSDAEALGMTIVHYRGETQVATDLVGNSVQAAFLSVPTARPLIATGRLRALGVLSEERVASLPGVATFSEQGMANITWKGVWIGVFAPRGVPDATLQRLVGETRAIAQDPDMQRAFLERDLTVKWLEPADFSSVIDADMTSWAAMIKKLGIRGQ